MLKTTFTLISKKNLTHDVYELIYSCPDMTREPPKPGQYLMFQLAPGLNRAYSLASFSVPVNLPHSELSDYPTIPPSDYPTFTLIIKRIPEGRWSPLICDAEIGTVFSGLLPLGHFTLRETEKSKCFIGTGTGFAPLYCQILGWREKNLSKFPITFIFGVRNFEDSFYEEEILNLGKDFEDFQYNQYFSRESDFSATLNSQHSTRNWYVTDWITRENIWSYEEYYLCGSPAMVKSAREKLEALGVAKEDIFWEQF